MRFTEIFQELSAAQNRVEELEQLCRVRARKALAYYKECVANDPTGFDPLHVNPQWLIAAYPNGGRTFVMEFMDPAGYGERMEFPASWLNETQMYGGVRDYIEQKRQEKAERMAKYEAEREAEERQQLAELQAKYG